MQQTRTSRPGKPGRKSSSLAPPLVAVLLTALFIAGAPARAAGLNDSGFATCADGTNAGLACVPAEPSGYPRQDARYGRDAAASAGLLNKIGGGGAGFDFTKVANDGSDIPDTAALGGNSTDWACTRDNVTGLVWEVKTTDGGSRDWANTYTWYSSDGTTNGSLDGVSPTGTDNGGVCTDTGNCDTEKFVAAVNAATLCNQSDWRLPTARELESLVDFSRYSLSNHHVATIDATYFPHTQDWLTAYWSGDSRARGPDYAWFVAFDSGVSYFDYKATPYYVRLVRSGP